LKMPRLPKVLKNRAAVGIVCLVASAIAIYSYFNYYYLTPVVRAIEPIPHGTQITSAMVREVLVGRYNLPNGELKSEKLVVGKYTTVDISSQDDITSSKVGSSGGMYDLQNGQLLMSVAVKTLADGLSGKLQSGDIVTVFYPPSSTMTFTTGTGTTQSQTQTAQTPPELQYVKVVSVTDSTGKSTDESVIEKSTGTNNSALPATVTLLVNDRQAQIIASHENDIAHLALADRGNQQREEELLQEQAAYFIQDVAPNSSTATSSAASTAPASTGKQNNPPSSTSKSSSSPSGNTSSATSAPTLNWGVK